MQTSVGPRDLSKSVTLPPQTPVGPRDLLESASVYSRVSSGNVGSGVNLQHPRRENSMLNSGLLRICNKPPGGGVFADFPGVVDYLKC